MAGQILIQRGAGSTGGGGGTPGGSNTQVQFNDSGAFGGDAGLTFDKTTNVLTLGNQLVISDPGSAGTPQILLGAGAGLYFPGTSQVGISGLLNAQNGIWLAAGDTTLFFGASFDLALTREAADVLAQRRGTNAQAFRLYGTFTDSSNYERAALSATAATKVTLAAETAGTGGDNLDLELVPAGTGVVQISNPQDGAAAQTATMTNGPTAGNPAIWLKVKIGANTRYIPAWA